MAALSPLPYYRAAAPRRPLNGETPVLSRDLPVMVIRAYNGRRHTISIQVTIEQASFERPRRHCLNPHETIAGAIELSMTGTEHAQGGMGGGGQMQDTIRAAMRDADAELLIPRGQLTAMLDTWDAWHLNDMRAGCAHQRRAGWGKTERLIPIEDRRGVYRHINDRRPLECGPVFERKLTTWLYPHQGGCLTKPCRVCGYRFGSEHLTESLPPALIAEVCSWFGLDAPTLPAPILAPAPLAYAAPRVPAAVALPAPPAGIVASGTPGRLVVWETDDRSRYASFTIHGDRLFSTAIGVGRSARPRETLYNLTPDEAIRVAIGWLS